MTAALKAIEASGFRAADQLTWLDVKDEQYREYLFGDRWVRVLKPAKLHVKRKPEGDSHRIITAEGMSYYIPAGWIALRWLPVDGTAAYAF